MLQKVGSTLNWNYAQVKQGENKFTGFSNLETVITGLPFFFWNQCPVAITFFRRETRIDTRLHWGTQRILGNHLGNSPLYKRKGNWSRNASRNCFWDGYWGRACSRRSAIGHSLVTVPEVFAQVNSSQFRSGNTHRLKKIAIETLLILTIGLR